MSRLQPRWRRRAGERHARAGTRRGRGSRAIPQTDSLASALAQRPELRDLDENVALSSASVASDDIASHDFFVEFTVRDRYGVRMTQPSLMIWRRSMFHSSGTIVYELHGETDRFSQAARDHVRIRTAHHRTNPQHRLPRRHQLRKTLSVIAI